MESDRKNKLWCAPSHDVFRRLYHGVVQPSAWALVLTIHIQENQKSLNICDKNYYGQIILCNFFFYLFFNIAFKKINSHMDNFFSKSANNPRDNYSERDTGSSSVTGHKACPNFLHMPQCIHTKVQYGPTWSYGCCIRALYNTNPYGCVYSGLKGNIHINVGRTCQFWPDQRTI